jgi:hypothetical protein
LPAHALNASAWSARNSPSLASIEPFPAGLCLGRGGHILERVLDVAGESVRLRVLTLTPRRVADRSRLHVLSFQFHARLESAAGVKHLGEAAFQVAADEPQARAAVAQKNR